MGFLSDPASIVFNFLKTLNFVFWHNIHFSSANDDIDISKTHLKKAEHIIKLEFYLRPQNIEQFALSASR